MFLFYNINICLYFDFIFVGECKLYNKYSFCGDNGFCGGVSFSFDFW